MLLEVINRYNEICSEELREVLITLPLNFPRLKLYLVRSNHVNPLQLKTRRHTEAASFMIPPRSVTTKLSRMANGARRSLKALQILLAISTSFFSVLWIMG